MAHIEIAQNSILKMYSNVEVTDGVELAFSSPEALNAYFAKRLVKQYTDMSYVYRNGKVTILDTPQVVANCNFISFKNPSFENKEIYARIVDYNYVNNATVDIIYAIDWWLTFMFDVSFESCQIQREHLSESDWAKAIANPWDRSILEMNTDEAFSFSDEDRGVISMDSNYHAIIPESPDVEYYTCIHLASAQYATREGVKDVYSRLAAWTGSFAPVDELPKSSLRLYPQRLTIDNLPRASAIYAIRNDVKVSQMAKSADIIGNEEIPAISGDDPVLKAGVDLLTAAGLTSEIISMYCLTGEMLDKLMGGDHPEATTITLNGRTANGTNPKLKRAPFSYLKAVGPDGTAKEFRYENFSSPADGISFVDVASFDGVPTYSLIPVNYKFGKVSGAVSGDMLNFKERLDYSGMVQIAYSVDCFLTYMSGEYQKAIQNTSWPALVSKGVKIGTSVADAFLGNTGSSQTTTHYDPKGNVTGATAMVTPSNQTETVMGAAGSIADSLMGLGSDINAITAMRGTAPIYDYSAEKATYIADQYVAGGGSGYLAYRFGRLWFDLFFMSLNPAMTATVDRFFNAFGYNSGRIGVPRICNFVQSSGAAPHFVELDGKLCTYIKTCDMHVESNLKPVSDYIAMVFNAGCRFIKGDGR